MRLRHFLAKGQDPSCSDECRPRGVVPTRRDAPARDSAKPGGRRPAPGTEPDPSQSALLALLVRTAGGDDERLDQIQNPIPYCERPGSGLKPIRVTRDRNV